MSTLHKQNFDLKLELFHRRLRMSALEEQLEQTESLRSHNAELQEVNEQLLQELVKRDQAIEEAVEIICQLEEKLDRSMNKFEGGVMEGFSMDTVEDGSVVYGQDRPQPSAPSTRDKGLTVASTPIHINAQAAPLRRRDDVNSSYSRRRARRTPSILAAEQDSWGTLRSLYLAGDSGGGNVPRLSGQRSRLDLALLNRSQSSGSVRSTTDGLDSPRLSVLSASSFLSIYGETRRAEGLDVDAGLARRSSPEMTLEQEDRYVSGIVEGSPSKPSWMAEAEEKSRMNARRQLSPLRTGKQYLSIENVLHKTPAGSPEDQFPLTERAQLRLSEPRPSSFAVESGPQYAAPSIQVPVFDPVLLPPTPDTLSTVDQEGFTGHSDTIAEKRPPEIQSTLEKNAQDTDAPRELIGRPEVFSKKPSDHARGSSTRNRGYRQDVSSAMDGDLDINGGLTPATTASLSARNSKGTHAAYSNLLLKYGPGETTRDLMFNGEGIADIVCGAAQGERLATTSRIMSSSASELENDVISSRLEPSLQLSPEGNHENVHDESLGDAAKPRRKVNDAQSSGGSNDTMIISSGRPVNVTRSEGHKESKIPHRISRPQTPHISIAPSPPRKVSIAHRLFSRNSNSPSLRFLGKKPSDVTTEPDGRPRYLSILSRSTSADGAFDTRSGATATHEELGMRRLHMRRPRLAGSDLGKGRELDGDEQQSEAELSPGTCVANSTAPPEGTVRSTTSSQLGRNATVADTGIPREAQEAEGGKDVSRIRRRWSIRRSVSAKEASKAPINTSYS